MNAKLATFMILLPSAALMAQGVSASRPGFVFRQDLPLVSPVSPESRGASDFANADWRAVRDEDLNRSSAHAAAREYARDYDGDSGPFTRDEARDMRAVWHTIRDAENFYDIDWRALGRSRAPGDREARRFMAQHWGSLRRAEQFDDINWRAEYHRR